MPAESMHWQNGVSRRNRMNLTWLTSACQGPPEPLTSGPIATNGARGGLL